MAYKVTMTRPTHRSTDLDEVQGYDDLRMIWKAVKESETGKRPELRLDVKAKIAKGLKRTVNEGVTSRTRLVAAAMILAINDRDWQRDVYRKPLPRELRLGGARAPERKGSKRSPRSSGQRDSEG